MRTPAGQKRALTPVRMLEAFRERDAARTWPTSDLAHLGPRQLISREVTARLLYKPQVKAHIEGWRPSERIHKALVTWSRDSRTGVRDCFE